MSDCMKPYGMIEDFVTGEKVPDVGAEANRQAVERLLVTDRGYARSEIAVGVPLVLEIAGTSYRSTVDLVVSVGGEPYMAIRCAAGSL